MNRKFKRTYLKYKSEFIGDRHLLYIINVFAVTFDQFNMPFLIKSINSIFFLFFNPLICSVPRFHKSTY